MKELLTVVIPCKNERLGLIICIVNILKDRNLNLIIADSSTDDTLEYLDFFNSLDFNIKIVDGGLPAVARNSGAKLVQTPYVLFIDADMDISDLHLERILMDVIKNDYHLVTTRIKSQGKYSKVYTLFNWIQALISKKTPFAVGGFMLFKTEEFNKLGGFNELDKFAEDFHLSMMVRPDKFKIYPFYTPTSSRRLVKKGLLYMIKLMVQCWLNKNNPDFFKNDHGYWKES